MCGTKGLKASECLKTAHGKSFKKWMDIDIDISVPHLVALLKKKRLTFLENNGKRY